MSFIFSTINEDGTITDVRTISRESMLACPHFIMVADHYREDETCRCDDPTHKEMIEWEYKWEGSKWVPTWEDDE